MSASVIRRLGWALITALVASIVAFLLFWTIPNVDPEFQLGGGVRGTDETRAEAVEEYGLDESLPVQYVRVMTGIFDGSASCFQGCDSVRSAFFDALPVTLSLVAGAAVLSIGGGVFLALVCVRFKGRWPDRVVSTAATAAYSVPSLVLSAVLWAFLAQKWRIFPYEGYVPLTEDPAGWAWHLLLPWIAAALPFMGAYTHIVRTSLLQVSEADWVRTARAKGLGEKTVLRSHMLRNAVVPPMNIWGLDFSHAFGGFALYVEVIFGLPGIGAFMASSLDALDLAPIVGLATFIAIVVVLVSVAIDIAAARLDPRIDGTR